MILAISRFRVRNGMEEEVDAAFRHRPRLVDDHPGFLGMEVFREAEDRTVFHLVTRWTDRASFEAWHGSADHKASHRFIPKGLKLDATYTRVVHLERIDATVEAGVAEEAVADAAPVLSDFLGAARGLYFLQADRDGRIRVANAAVARAAGAAPEALRGAPVWPLLSAESAERLREHVGLEPRRRPDPVPLDLATPDGATVGLRCVVDVHPGQFFLLGEPR